MNWELSKKEFTKFDPDSYSILKRLVDNGLTYEELNAAISEKIKQVQKKEIKKDEFKKEFIDLLKDRECAFIDLNVFASLPEKINIKQYLKELEDEHINKRKLYTKSRHSRVAFYQIEHALHYQLRQMLIPDPQKEEVTFLGNIYKEEDDFNSLNVQGKIYYAFTVFRFCVRKLHHLFSHLHPGDLTVALSLQGSYYRYEQFGLS